MSRTQRNRWRRHRRLHAKIRAEERYGVWLNNQDLINIVGMIRSDRVRTLRRLSHSKSVKVVEYEGARMIALYSHRHHEIITFLPVESHWGVLAGMTGKEV